MYDNMIILRKLKNFSRRLEAMKSDKMFTEKMSLRITLLHLLSSKRFSLSNEKQVQHQLNL